MVLFFLTVVIVISTFPSLYEVSVTVLWVAVAVFSVAAVFSDAVSATVWFSVVLPPVPELSATALLVPLVAVLPAPPAASSVAVFSAACATVVSVFFTTTACTSGITKVFSST